jgi:hypothetical protein
VTAPIKVKNRQHPAMDRVMRSGRAAPVHLPQGRGRFLSGCAKGHVMSKRENDANNIFRASDSPLTEHEKEQIALRKNLERLRAERLAREAANAGHSPKQKDRRSDRRSFR